MLRMVLGCFGFGGSELERFNSRNLRAVGFGFKFEPRPTRRAFKSPKSQILSAKFRRNIEASESANYELVGL